MNAGMAEVGTGNPQEGSILNALKKTAGKALASDLLESATAAGLSQAGVLVAGGPIARVRLLGPGRICSFTQVFPRMSLWM